MNGSILVLILLYFVVFPILRRASSKKKDGEQNSRRGQTPPSAGQTFVQQVRSARTETAPKRSRGRKDEFDYGEASHRYSHVSDKRLRQVESYLKAGLIDKKEYQQMLERYSREENCFDDQ